MLLCPHTNTKLVNAKIKGGTIWYSPSSGGRMLSMAMCRHYLGQHESQELWMRSENSELASDLPCPSCRNNMRRVIGPGWVEHIEVGVCRRCFVVWLEAGEHPKVPQPHLDLDTNVQKIEQKVAHLEIKVSAEKAREEREKLLGPAPDSLLESIPAFLGLPVEISDRGKPAWPILSALLIVATTLIFLIRHDSHFLTQWGFYPGEPLKNYGFNLFFSAFLHASWIHLIGNLYFFYVFSDDIEDDLGPFKFALFIICTILVGGVISTLLRISPNIPHVGLSGVVMSMMSYYALRFPKVKMAYLVPAIHYSVMPKEGFIGRIAGMRWVHVPVYWMYISYFLFNLIGYFALQKNGLSRVSFSAHLFGIATGVVLYFLWGSERRQYEYQYPKEDKNNGLQIE